MITDIKVLANAIQQANRFFLSQIQKQVNTSFTLRNWMIGYYLAEYEQNGKDRAEYGEQLYKKLSEKLKKKGVKGKPHYPASKPAVFLLFCRADKRSQ
ncbi:MAG: hypothetical protein BGO55_18895 [Sphingobacteriales bacterium 50-39]|nr:hypothetical protein [Sphingobacteriales bacterium]OJW55123.1 MAG: hypothetical protein BGO55_18895 [Sphingobacteriales bacterium 50-39]